MSPNEQHFSSMRTTGPRTIRAPRGTTLSCKGWQQEAAMRMLMNNLDPEVAERPDDLVVYGGSGRRVLAQVRLSTDDLLAEGTRYWLAEDAYGHPVGVVGLEMGLTAALLRSAAVNPSLHIGGPRGQQAEHVQFALTQWVQ